MSDIYFRKEQNPISPPKLSNFFDFTTADWHTATTAKDSYIYLRRNDNERIWSPVINRNNTSMYVLGRVNFDAQTWEHIKSLPNESGGLVCNYLFQLYQQKGINGLLEKLNGGYGILIKEANEDITVITDKMGFFPIYYANNATKTVMSSHPDAIAKDFEFASLDMTSLGEYLTYGAVENPNTYYQYVKQLAPGCVYKFSLSNPPLLLQKYFNPEFKWQNESPRELIKELRNALYEAVQDRTNVNLGKSGVFLSGGMDSRGILASSSNPAAITSATFYDEANEELATAQAIAKAYGSPHLALKRTKEFYIENAQQAAIIMGGQWSVTDAHYTGFIPELLASDVENWLSGCFADWMFKGLASNTKYLTLFGKVVPVIKRLGEFDKVYYKAKYNIGNTTLKSAIEFRKNAIYENIEGLTGEKRYWNIEKVRLFPINREADMGSRHMLSRTLRWDPVLADNRLLEVFQKIPVAYKLKHNIWGNAVASICQGHNDIKDNNWGTKVNAGELEKIASFIIENIKRKINKSAAPKSGIVMTGSWPNFHYVANQSERLPIIWSNISKESFQVVEELTGVDYAKENHLNLVNNNLEYFFRLLTLLLWLDTTKDN